MTREARRPSMCFARRAAPGGLVVATFVLMALPANGRGASRGAGGHGDPGGSDSASIPPSPSRGTRGKDDEAIMTALLARFAKAPGILARYREEKHLAMLQAPLTSEGTIHFTPPGRLARHTVKPIKSTLLIDDNKVQFGGAEGAESMDLGTNPVARAFVDSFVMLLAGNRAGLERYFTIHFTSLHGPKLPTGAWHLALVPRTSPMDKVIKEITLDGADLTISTMVLRESSGDWTSTVFQDVDVSHKYDAAEQARVFRIQK
jgi:hypothetical protein